MSPPDGPIKARRVVAYRLHVTTYLGGVDEYACRQLALQEIVSISSGAPPGCWGAIRRSASLIRGFCAAMLGHKNAGPTKGRGGLEEAVAVILLTPLLVVVFAGLGFALHALWILAAILLALPGHGRERRQSPLLSLVTSGS